MTARRSVASILGLIVVGCIGLFLLTLRPRFQAYHTVDVLQLVASGMCFGVALARIAMVARGSSER
jgi:hypothetical protein